MSWLSDLTGVNIDAADYSNDQILSAAQDTASTAASALSSPAPAPAPAAAAKPASTAATPASNFLKNPVAFGLSGGALLMVGVAVWFLVRHE